MKILMLVNWKIEYCRKPPADKQPPDYYVEGEPYWFFRYFKSQPEVDVLDICSVPWLERFEKNVLRFYIWQTIRAIVRLHKYDVVISHGMQSGIVLSLWRRLFHTRAKHIVFDIGSFNSAAEQGAALKLMQFASKSIDGLIYHTSSQITYYKNFFPWLVDKSRFIRFGPDLDFFDPGVLKPSADADKYVICLGAAKRDWDTLIEAYKQLHTDVKLRLVGHVDQTYEKVEGVEQIPFLPIREVVEQIYNSQLAVLPLESFNYSYGQMTLLQQMALGKCVVAARVPSLVDYVEDGRTGVLYKPKDCDDLREKMESIIKDNVRRNEIAQGGRDFLLDKCNERIMAEKIEQTIKRFVGGGEMLICRMN